MTDMDIMIANQISLMYADDEVVANIEATGLYNVHNTVDSEES